MRRSRATLRVSAPELRSYSYSPTHLRDALHVPERELEHRANRWRFRHDLKHALGDAQIVHDLEGFRFDRGDGVPCIAARRLLGAECCSFLHSVDVAAERWRPFHRCASQLTGEDTIVTFNYDRVVELVGADKTRERACPTFFISNLTVTGVWPRI